ncbi:MAG TPA: FtsL-like putative cell division protein [Bacillota bacterium]|mgnify:FL=1|nr:FtsL-like putative cell division protein [Bacillota bacterium]HNT03869.1 FtsL-like putative cell division protein [Bacillota bacterium]HNU79161.1 FtsL-like putative cell division protein [Bacillota bacterium]HPA54821.1 FtsL-like putative cell division protein [Bacillota bacterium]HPL98560.1 FtsL-like putative cell division protein [Bacillota bacterium]
MLRADNTAYDYSRYEQLEMEQVREIAASPRKKVHKKEKHKTHLMSILFVFGLSIFIISRYAYMAEINYNIKNLEKEYSALVKENTDLNVQLMKSISLETLEKKAIEELGMQYPDIQNQIAYVNVEIPAQPAGNEARDFYNIDDLQENKYIAYTKAVINNILKVLD